MIELTDEEADVLRRLLRAVGGVVPEFVIAGGQAARLLRLHPLATRLDWNALLTTDTDVATIDKGHRGNDLAQAFEAEGFTAVFEGDDVPPRTHDLRGTAEIELIVPDVARRHSSGVTVKILGASAQKVKNLEPLLVEPTVLEVPNVGRVRVPNPAGYIIQKVLTVTDRREAERRPHGLCRRVRAPGRRAARSSHHRGLRARQPPRAKGVVRRGDDPLISKLPLRNADVRTDV
jgi:hypothetical protein